MKDRLMKPRRTLFPMRGAAHSTGQGYEIEPHWHMPVGSIVMNAISLFLAVLLISVSFTPVAAQDTNPSNLKSVSTLEVERKLKKIDEEILQLESQKKSLDMGLQILSSKPRSSRFSFKESFSKLDKISSEEEGNEVDTWQANLRDFFTLAWSETNKASEFLYPYRDQYISWGEDKSASSIKGLWKKHLDQTDIPDDMEALANAIENVETKVINLKKSDIGSQSAKLRGPKLGLSEIKQKMEDIEPKINKAANEVRQSIQQEVNRQLSLIKEQLANLSKKQAGYVKELGERREGEVRVDEKLITYAVPALGIFLVLLTVLPSFYKKEAQNLILNSGLILEMTTVFLLTVIILLLGIAGKLSAEVLGTLIGGISGYVLGRWRSQDSMPHRTDSGQSTSPEAPPAPPQVSPALSGSANALG